MALGVIKYLNELKYSVPNDISIVSFDNSIFAECSSPTLTSVGADVFKLGQRTIEKLINIRHGGFEPVEEWVDMKIYENDSVKAIATEQ